MLDKKLGFQLNNEYIATFLSSTYQTFIYLFYSTLYLIDLALKALSEVWL